MSNLGSSQFAPPQSAQPYTSIFGGSSSQDVTGFESESEIPRGADIDEDEDEDDVFMRDFPLEIDPSDDDTFNGYDDEDTGSEDSFKPRSTRYESQKRNSTSATTTTNQRNLGSPSMSPSYRPNRFRGPETTWRTLTAEDRQNAQALEDIRARDLAAHLYNAHVLRVRAREIARQAADMKDQRNDLETFLPPKRWAAWPVPPNEVPRRNELRQDDEIWTLRMHPDPRPSADLEESVTAVLVKRAKEMFNARDWHVVRSTPQQKGAIAPHPGTQEESAAEPDMKSDPDSDVEQASLRPVVQADDSQSHKQLLPITRNIITDLDRLLMGLHHGRKAGVAPDDSSASEWQSDTASIASGSSASRWKEGRAMSEESRGSQSRGRKRIRKSSTHGMSTSGRSQKSFASSRANSSRSRGRSVGSDSKRPSSNFRLGLRDWSEVVGVASMVGLPPTVVMRTAQRCAALFGEDMAFQTFREGKLRSVRNEDSRAWEYAENDSESPQDLVSSPSPPPPPKKKPRSRAHSTKKRSVSRLTSTGPEGGAQPKGQAEQGKSDLTCPLRSCSRHAKGFSRRWNLNLHMKRMHPKYVPRSGNKSPAVIGPDDEISHD
ncbi:hypothetical protein FE257_008340 [Aspergillus nanangensis]|uniref:Rrn9 domain-containing protein n=1 Tax=Aspergillus nanangensis TaxID=2582783 RepID=A0AAD4CLJ9_ASPNN|nr:hypothetical protein FE257_008340 [Aspergillus nanangensis]